MRMNATFPKEIEEQLDRMVNLDKIALKMLDAAAPELVKAVKKRLKKHDRTGELINSVKARKTKKTKTDAYIKKIEFAGYDKKRKPTPSQPRGVPNAVKAAGIEYGNANQTPEPFLQSAVNDSESKSVEIMQEVYEREAKING